MFQSVVSPKIPCMYVARPPAESSVILPQNGHRSLKKGRDINGAIAIRRRQKPSRKARLYKTVLCQSWMESGRCNYGNGCQYAHGESDKRTVPIRHPNYKTKQCNKFSRYGVCPYGSRCNFAHDDLLKECSINDLPSRMKEHLNSQNDRSKSLSISDQNSPRFLLNSNFIGSNFPFPSVNSPKFSQSSLWPSVDSLTSELDLMKIRAEFICKQRPFVFPFLPPPISKFVIPDHF